MKELLDYCWKHRFFGELMTSDDKTIDVIDPGLFNRNKGPEFFNAKIEIGGTLLVGNIEILEKSSEWNLNGYNQNKSYDNVILLVTASNDCDIFNSENTPIQQVVVSVPETISKNYKTLLDGKCDDCLRFNAEHCSQLMIHAWMAALQTEWLEQATEKLKKLSCDLGKMNDAYFVMLARQFGFGINDDVYELWAKSLPFEALRHHSDDLFQLEAIMLGQAGLLELEVIPEKYQIKALNEGYFAKIRNEYIYLSHKYSLSSIDYHEWRGGVNAHYSPQRCISWLANYFYMRHERSGYCLSLEELKMSFNVNVTPYWETHSQFGKVYEYGKKLMQINPNDLVLKVDVPYFFAYGRCHENEECCDHAFNIMEQCLPRKGKLNKWFEAFGFRITTGGDSLAVIQQKHEYCMKKQCLRCRFGYEYMKIKR